MGDIRSPAPNFNTFYASFLTVFQVLGDGFPNFSTCICRYPFGSESSFCLQVLTLENWEEIMFSTIQASGMQSVFLFFVVWVLIGKFVLLSLFLAVILEV